jgi:hydrogenase expression/formation protein HypC
MCLAIPGKVLEVEERDGSRIARVQYGGVTSTAYLDFVPEAVPGDYVIVHVGFAISRLDAEEAEKTFRILEEMGLLEEEGLGAESNADSEAGDARPGPL